MSGGTIAEEKRFADFEIWISPSLSGSPADYPVLVTQSPDGHGAGTMKLDVGDSTFGTKLKQVQEQGCSLKAQQAFGAQLFEALFAGEVGKRWTGSLGFVKAGQADGLRIRLVINEPSLANLPWELLYDGETGFLAKTSNQVLSRYLPVPETPVVRTHDQLRILLVVESPDPGKWPAVDVKEAKNLQEAIGSLSERVKLDVLENAAIGGIQSQLQKQDYDVLHYLGHGASGALILVDTDGKTPKPIKDHVFAQFFRGRGNMRLIVLNACSSSQKTGGGLFSGVGPALVRNGLPAVVAMQYSAVYLDTAAEFSKRLYGALAQGLPVDVAVNEGRQYLFGLNQDDRDWSTPVLYMGTRRGRILYFPGTDVVQAAALESPLAAAALEEVAFRAVRLCEWLDFEPSIGDLRRSVEELGQYMNPALDAVRRKRLDDFWTNINKLEEEWGRDCPTRIDQLTKGFRYLRQPLPPDSPQIENWFKELIQLRDGLEVLLGELVTNSILHAEAQLGPDLIKVFEQYKKLSRFVRDRSGDGMTYRKGESKELQKRAERFMESLSED